MYLGISKLYQIFIVNVLAETWIDICDMLSFIFN